MAIDFKFKDGVNRDSLVLASSFFGVGTMASHFDISKFPNDMGWLWFTTWKFINYYDGLEKLKAPRWVSIVWRIARIYKISREILER